MSSSIVEICNRAIESVNVDPIDSLDDDTKQARLCKRLFPQLRDAMARNCAPSFARTRAVLPALAAPPPFGFPTAFQLPADCLRVLPLHDSWRGLWSAYGECDGDYTIEGKTVLTNAAAPLHIRYVRQVLDSQLFDPLFTDALVASLGVNLVMPLKNDRTLLQTLETILDNRTMLARGIDVAEKGDHSRRTAAVLLARR